MLAPGNYRVGNVLAIRGEQVVVSGYGATLTATSPDAQAVEITGRNATLVGVTLVGTGTQRLESSTSAKVFVDGYGIQGVLDVTIRGGASAGISSRAAAASRWSATRSTARWPMASTSPAARATCSCRTTPSPPPATT